MSRSQLYEQNIKKINYDNSASKVTVLSLLAFESSGRKDGFSHLYETLLFQYFYITFCSIYPNPLTIFLWLIWVEQLTENRLHIISQCF